MGRSVARVAVAVAGLLAALVVAPTAAAQTTDPQEVLKREPYYLGLYEAEGRSRGTVLMLHGGGWRGDQGQRADDTMREWIDGLVSWGYDVANVGYRSGLPSLVDALDAFDLVRDRVGPKERLCIFGGSAGAHLGLFVAAQRRDDVDCVVDLLGPPDLVTWGAQPASAAGLQLAREAFGEERLAALSPISMVERIVSPVLVIAAPCDIFIELSAQQRFVDELNAAGGSARLQVVDEGDEIPLGHCAVERESFEELLGVMRQFLGGELPPAEAATPAEDGSDVGVLVAIAAAVAIGGLALVGWRRRRRG